MLRQLTGGKNSLASIHPPVAHRVLTETGLDGKVTPKKPAETLYPSVYPKIKTDEVTAAEAAEAMLTQQQKDKSIAAKVAAAVKPTPEADFELPNLKISRSGKYAEEFKNVADCLSDTGTEISFIIGTVISLLNYTEAGVSDVANDNCGCVWNIFDGTCTLLAAAGMLAVLMSQKKSPDKAAQQKQMLMLLGVSGIQLFGATVASMLIPAMAVSLPAVSFALAAGIDFVISIQTAIDAHHRAYDFEVWLAESLKELSDLIAKERLIDDPEFDQVINPDVTKKKEQLELEIKARINVYCNSSELDEPERDRRVSKVNALLLPYEKIQEKPIPPMFQSHLEMPSIVSTVHAIKKHANLDSKQKAVVSPDEIRLNQQVQEKLEQDVNCKVLNTIVKGISFVGMVMVAIPFPPVQAVGFVISTTIAMFYLVKNILKLIDKLCQKPTTGLATHSLFNAAATNGHRKATTQPEVTQYNLGYHLCA